MMETNCRNEPCGRTPLAEGTSLRRRYTVQRTERFNEGALTYSGFDYIARQPVTILEFFPAEIASREAGSLAVSPKDRESGALFFLGMEAFYRQYNKLLQTIGSPNVLSIFDVFFENGTAYAIAELTDGLTLNEYLLLERRGLTDGELVYIARALADALLVVHSCNLLHHGITAETILLCPDGTVKLTDFAAGLVSVQSGRAVREDEPWVDIHTLGETLFRAYAGGGQSVLPMYMDETMPRSLSTLFAGMLSDSASHRFASVFDLRYTAASLDIRPVRPNVSASSREQFEKQKDALFAAKDKSCSVPAQQVRKEQAPERQAAFHQTFGTPQRMHNGWLMAAIGIVLLALLAILVWVLARW